MTEPMTPERLAEIREHVRVTRSCYSGLTVEDKSLDCVETLLAVLDAPTDPIVVPQGTLDRWDRLHDDISALLDWATPDPIAQAERAVVEAAEYARDNKPITCERLVVAVDALRAARKGEG